MKVGILGGTFDPIHSGHLMIAEAARKKLELKRIIFVPAGEPWLKSDHEITPAFNRVEMVRMAIEGQPNYELSTLEVDRPGPSYSVDTVDILRRNTGDSDKLYFLMGWDSLKEIPEWHQPKKLTELCTLVAVTRPGMRRPNLDRLEKSVPGIARNLLWLDIPPIDINSSDIRKRVAKGLSISGMVPAPVERYIKENELYRKY